MGINLLAQQGSRETIGAKPLVLVADDESVIRTYVKIILERAGIEALEAADGSDALALFHAMGGNIDLVVSDMRMPGLTGMQLANAIRSESPNMPVIFISSEPDSHHLHNPANGVIYLEKPFQAKDILFASQRLLPAR